MAISSPINVGNISKGVNSLKAGLGRVKTSAQGIRSVLFKKTTVKQQAITGKKSLQKRRSENVLRKDQEDLLEASGIKPTIRGTRNAIVDSTKGFLGRILDFVGTLFVGWLLYNLPTIIAMTKDLIIRIQTLFGALTGFVGNLFNVFGDIGHIIGGVLSDIVHLDFLDTDRKVRGAFDDLNTHFDNMGKQFEDGVNVFKTSLGSGKGEEPIPSTGTPSGQTPFGQPQYPDTGGAAGGGGGGGKWKPLLDLISSGEGGYTSIAPGDQNPNLTKMTIAEANRAVGIKGGKGAIGRYQFTTPISQAKRSGLDPNKDLFSPENQDKMAINLIMERGGGNWLSGKITDEQFSESLAHEWGSFRSASGYVLPNNSGAIGFDKLKPTLKKVKGGGGTAQVSSAPQAQFGQPQYPDTGAPVRGRSAAASLSTAAQSLKGMSSASGPGGGRTSCVWAVNQVFAKAGIKPPWGTSEYVPTAEEMMIKSGYQRIPNGKQKPGDLYIVNQQEHIGIVLPNGNIISNSSSGAKFSWEASLAEYQSSFGGPGKFYRLPGSTISSTGSNAPGQLNNAANSISSTITSPGVNSQLNQQITPERRGSTIVVMNQPQQAPSGGGGGGGGGGSAPVIPSSDGLNSFIKQNLLLDLAYT